MERRWVSLRDATPLLKKAKKLCARLLPESIVVHSAAPESDKAANENISSTPQEEIKNEAISDNQEEEQSGDGSSGQPLLTHNTDWLVAPIEAAAAIGGSVLLQSGKDTAQGGVDVGV